MLSHEISCICDKAEGGLGNRTPEESSEGDTNFLGRRLEIGGGMTSIDACSGCDKEKIHLN